MSVVPKSSYQVWILRTLPFVKFAHITASRASAENAHPSADSLKPVRSSSQIPDNLAKSRHRLDQLRHLFLGEVNDVVLAVRPADAFPTV